MGKTEEEFQMTNDEAQRVKEALKNKEFMDLFMDYAKEISDPVNKKKYEEEIIAMEKQRGQDIRLLKPQSGFVIKTVRLSDNMKVFLNICTSPEVNEHEMKHVKEGTNVSLPHSVSPVREDIDKAGKSCLVYDVCFNPKSYDKGLKEENFRQTMIDSAFDTIEDRLSIKLDRKNKKFPKMKYKGQARPLILRSEKTENNINTSPAEATNPLNFPYPETSSKLDVNGTANGMVSNKENFPVPREEKSATEAVVIPKYKVVHRGYFEMTDYTGGRSQSTTTPKELVVEIELPLAKSANGLDLDIFTQQLILNSEKPSYFLDISLPYKIDEEQGKAQFDKSKKVLTVTLPIIKSEYPTENLLNGSVPSPPPLIQECVDNTVNEQPTTNEAEESSPNKMTNNNNHVDEQEDGDTLSSAANGDVLEDRSKVTMLDLEDATFDTKNIGCMPINAQLPPYAFDQTLDSVIVVVKIPGIKVEDLSLGISQQQVCFSVPQDVDDSYSSDWSMVIRLDDKYFLDKDECGFELYEDRMELNLRKTTAELWERFFVGVSETSLKMELFLTETTAAEIVEQLKALNVDKLPRAPVIANEELKKTMSLENRLEQLLSQQEKEAKLNQMKYEACDNKDDGLSRSQHAKFGSDGSDLDVQNIDLMDLVDDVIEENSPVTSPTTTTNNDFLRTNRTIERSLSHDNYHPRLRSILKRCKSDGAANGTDTDDDATYHRTRATTYSASDVVYSEPENNFARRRHKSVSFLDEPIVFEFTKMTKWQWKKASLKKQKHEKDKKRKEKRENQMSSTDQTASSTDEEKAAAKQEKVESKQVEKQEKHGRKWRKAEKKRNRNNSESRSEEENDGNKGQSKKKGKRKKKNQKAGNINFQTTNNGSDSGMGNESEAKPSLNNPLIFQLD